MSDLVLLKFLQGKPPFNAGEQAGVAPSLAETYVEAGVAEYVNKKVEVKAQTEPPKNKAMFDAPKFKKF